MKKVEKYVEKYVVCVRIYGFRPTEWALRFFELWLQGGADDDKPVFKGRIFSEGSVILITDTIYEVRFALENKDDLEAFSKTVKKAAQRCKPKSVEVHSATDPFTIELKLNSEVGS